MVEQRCRSLNLVKEVGLLTKTSTFLNGKEEGDGTYKAEHSVDDPDLCIGVIE